jgi:hypothetical protein
MAEQRRITPDEVIAAYRKTGLRPVKRAYCLYLCPPLCGCPITAIYLATLDGLPVELPKIEFEANKWADREFGSDYKNSFTDGFDNSRSAGR